jgi:cell division initiation protein
MTSDDSHGPGIGPGNSPATGPIGAAAVPPPQTGPIGAVRPADPATGGLLGAPPPGPVDAAPATGGLLGAPPTGQVTAIGPRLTPESVRRAAFDRAGIGRRGYSEADVERFRNRVVQEIGQANAEKAELRREHQRLRAEIQRLRDYYRRNRVDVDKNRGAEPPQGAVYEEPPTGELVPVGAAAAEAGRVAEEQQQQQHAPQEDPNEMQYLQSRLAYMRTFAQVTQVQLRSILDALRTELDQLTELPAAPGGSAAPAVSAAPAGRTVDIRHPQYQR